MSLTPGRFDPAVNLISRLENGLTRTATTILSWVDMMWLVYFCLFVSTFSKEIARRPSQRNCCAQPSGDCFLTRVSPTNSTNRKGHVPSVNLCELQCNFFTALVFKFPINNFRQDGGGGGGGRADGEGDEANGRG